MSRRLIAVLALLLVVGITTVYAEVQNVKVSGDLTVQAVRRDALTLKDNDDFAGNGGYAVSRDYGPNISAILSHVRIRVDADLTDNVSVTTRLINERAWGAESADQGAWNYDSTRVALDLAYVTLKEFLYSPLTLTVGRQELRFGNAFIIGDVDTNNRAAGHNGGAPTSDEVQVLPNSLDDLSLRKSFDAVRANLNYDPVVVDLVYAKIDENNVAEKDDVDLYGVNVGYTHDKNIFIEGYWWLRSRQNDAAGNAAGEASIFGNGQETENLHVIGLRGVYTGVERLVAQLEGAWQFGDHVIDQDVYANDAYNWGATGAAGTEPQGEQVVRAWGLQAMLDYALPVYEKYSPMVGLHYTYLTGANYESIDDHYNGWDPMFEDQMGGTLINKIFGMTNCQMYTLTTSLKPIEDVRVQFDATYAMMNKAIPTQNGNTLTQGVWLTNYPFDPRYQMSGGNKELGTELDLYVTYDYTEDVQFGLNTGVFFPGSAFHLGALPAVAVADAGEAQCDRIASQVIGSMKVTF